MDNKRLERVEAKLDDIHEHLASIDITMVRNTVSLEEHVKRSNLLELKLAPVERHVAMMNGALKLLGIIAAVVAIAAGIHTLLK